ncbi:MAG: hypothetical protein HYR85_26125 [Planctomycetes bacterium]|nr:hypothetical protein [Planctomycetota bacterium]MBI3848078.1 hypothetical protein [Planctomycetota bacterium]
MLPSVALFGWIALAAPSEPTSDVVVFVDPGKSDEFLPAARALAALHQTKPKHLDPKNIRRAILDLRKSPPRFVAFVLPPEDIDIDLAHAILEASAELDGDSFPDFAYGFVTGRDGAAASRFVDRIAAAWKRDFGKSAGTFTGGPLFARRKKDAEESNVSGFGFTAKSRWASAKEGDAVRAESAQEGLADLRGLDALLFYSHGSPRGLDSCFNGQEFTRWKIDLSPAILFNCACFNGAPSRWFFSPSGKPTDRGPTPRDQSVALALLDSGISGYFASVDDWHGILADQAFLNVADDGLPLGLAAKRMLDRVALEFHGKPMHFEPAGRLRDVPDKDAIKRRAGTSTIFYGDPSWAPYATTASRSGFSEFESLERGKARVRIGLHALRSDSLHGSWPLLLRDRLISYYGDTSGESERVPLAMEIYRVVALPEGYKGTPSLSVVSARAGEMDVPTGDPRLAIEETPEGRFLHVLVPLAAGTDSPTFSAITTNGLAMELVGNL